LGFAPFSFVPAAIHAHPRLSTAIHGKIFPTREGGKGQFQLFSISAFQIDLSRPKYFSRFMFAFSAFRASARFSAFSVSTFSFSLSLSQPISAFCFLLSALVPIPPSISKDFKGAQSKTFTGSAFGFEAGFRFHALPLPDLQSAFDEGGSDFLGSARSLTF
jgi:hypothetical protein